MNGSTLQALLAGFPTKRILIIGDVILDEFLWGDARRISPEAPVPVVEVRSRTFVPGGAGNAAANVVSLEGSALLGGVVGRDAQAERLAEALQRLGVATEGLVPDMGRLTTTKTRLIANSQQVVRMDWEQRTALPLPVEDALLRWIDQHVPEADACILSDYGKGVVSRRVAEHLVRGARAAGKPVIVDPKGTDYAKYRGTTVAKPNIHEVEQFLKDEIQGEGGLLEAGRRLVDFLGGTALLITRGAEGMSLFREGLPPVHVPAVAHQVSDITGAGDTVVSTLALALAAGAPLEQAVYLANLAAGLVVAKRGTATVALDELRDGVPAWKGENEA